MNVWGVGVRQLDFPTTYTVRLKNNYVLSVFVVVHFDCICTLHLYLYI